MEQNNTKVNGTVENDCNEEEALSPEEKSKREKVDCSHRVIEKRRRDRINSSLMQLSKLVPVEKLNKKNSGKLEKAEILEVTVRYLEQQQEKKKKEQTEIAENAETQEQNEKSEKGDGKEMPVFLRGFKQCITDATKFFRDVEELDVSEGRCFRLIQHLKRQISRYESKEKDMSNGDDKDRLVWDSSESSDVSNRRTCGDWNQMKRKNGDLDGSLSKKARFSIETNTKTEPASNGTEQDRSSGRSPSNSIAESSSSMESNSNSRNYMPFVFPNMPLFTTLPFTGSNNMPRFPSSSSHFPGYQYQQSPQYIPVALPQFPVMGMNFMPSFGMVNGEQSQNGPMANQVPTSLSMHTSTNQSMSGLLPANFTNTFIPSMYTNGVHANIMAMRPRDSGYESSEKSASVSSSKESSETSPQSFSDDSCQSYVN